MMKSPWIWNRRKLTCASGALALSLVAFGCGSENTPTSVGGVQNAVVPACPSGQYRIGGTCVIGATYQQACSNVFGTIVTSSGRELCRTQKYFVNPATYGWFSFSGYNSIWTLTPSNPSGPYAFNTGLSVKAGDKITHRASGGWGGISYDSFSILGGFISGGSYSYDCDQFSLNGRKDGTTYTNEGLAAGLVGTDGTEVFLLGTYASKTVINAGTLKFGFNLPASSYGLCSSATITELTVQHCEDVSGTTYPCP